MTVFIKEISSSFHFTGL